MKKLLMAGMLAAAGLYATPASAAFGITQDLVFTTTASGFAASFGNEGDVSLGFTDTYQFELSDLINEQFGFGLATSSVITITLQTSNLVNLTAAELESGGVITAYTGPTATNLPDGSVLYTFALPTTALNFSAANPDQFIRISGSSATGGAYSGTFNITAVPEPATWAMMLTGFGAIGYSIRRRKAHRLVQAV